MRFNLNSQIIDLKDYLISQLSDMPYSLFPPRENWRMLFIPTSSKLGIKPQNLLIFSERKKIVCFLLADEYLTAEKSSEFSLKNLSRLLKTSGLKFSSVEVVLATVEDYATEAMFIADFHEWKFPVLIYHYGRISFRRGTFEDKVLNSRSAKQSISRSLFLNRIDMPGAPAHPASEEVAWLLTQTATAILGLALTGKSSINSEQLADKIFDGAMSRRDKAAFASLVKKHLVRFIDQTKSGGKPQLSIQSTSGSDSAFSLDLSSLHSPKAIDTFIQQLQTEIVEGWRLSWQLSTESIPEA